ncbi:MAG: hypothetical protein M1823_005570 [Watsoniomyces obsoletus]|nr:MAG: hypothetical protein M1823_005570 [Watsoniomyces obsoletus]
MFTTTLIPAFLLLLSLDILPSEANTPKSDDRVIHFPIYRRGGLFNPDEAANLTYLNEQLGLVRGRYNQTRRAVQGNKIVRKPIEMNGELMGSVGRNGNWFAKFKMAEPEQTVETDLDMLTYDHFLYTTTSRLGSHFLDFHSQTYEKTPGRPFPSCDVPKEFLHLPTIHQSAKVSLAHCRPAKSSIETLRASGSLLGLAPSKSLSQTRVPSLLNQLVDQKVIKKEMFGLLLLNGEEGVFSIGGSSADVVDQVILQNQEALERMGQIERGELSVVDGAGGVGEQTQSPDDGQGGGGNVKLQKRATIPGPDTKTGPIVEGRWEWSKVQGAAGWWQILMHGVYVEERRVLKNQPVIIDINTPFILGPPMAVRKFYRSVPGAHQLRYPNDHFWVFPCLNPPDVQFEFNRHRFAVLHGAKRVRTRPMVVVDNNQEDNKGNKKDDTNDTVQDNQVSTEKGKGNDNSTANAVINENHGNGTINAINQGENTKKSRRILKRRIELPESTYHGFKEDKVEEEEEEEEEVQMTTHIGGKFSLGKLRPGSGYCVGAVVETKFGGYDDRDYYNLHDHDRRDGETQDGADGEEVERSENGYVDLGR